MNQYKREGIPECLNNSITSSKQKKVEQYKKIVFELGARKKKWKISSIWNEWDIKTDDFGEKVSDIRIQLLKMTNYSCAFCGKRIDNSTLEVEHYLPSSKFPFIAYCWENYLPSCNTCNSRYKKTFFPKSLKTKKIIEEIIIDKELNKLIDGICSEMNDYNYEYNKDEILGNISKEHRLIDSTYDKVDEHLVFHPEVHTYEIVNNSTIGETTKKLIFEHSSTVTHFRKISQVVKNIIKKGADYSTLEDFVKIDGYEFYYKKYFDYWLSESNAGRIDV